MCTNIGATGNSVAPKGGVYIGGVSDDPYDIRTKVIVRHPERGHAFIGTHLAPLAEASAQDYSELSKRGANTRFERTWLGVYLDARARAAGQCRP